MKPPVPYGRWLVLLPASSRDQSVRWRRYHKLYLGYFEVEADDPLDQPGQRALIRQLGTKGCRAWFPDDFAVVKFRAHRGARLSREGDLICS